MKRCTYGISAGGYLVPRVLTVEKRVRACVACSVISDFYAYMSQNPAALKLAQHPDSLLMKMVIALRKYGQAWCCLIPMPGAGA